MNKSNLSQPSHTMAYISVIFVVICAFIGAFGSLDLPSYLLHQVGTLLMLITLLYYHCKIHLSRLSLTTYAIGFLGLHIFAAHYLYSFVPYNEWLIHYVQFDLNAFFGWQRNMFDRLIHFCYGLLLYPFFYQVTHYYFAELSLKKLLSIILLWVMASSMFYELIEWWIAITLSPEQAEHYNGQQGDMWDAHKDMFLATLGCMMAMLIHYFSAKHR